MNSLCLHFNHHGLLRDLPLKTEQNELCKRHDYFVTFFSFMAGHKWCSGGYAMEKSKSFTQLRVFTKLYRLFQCVFQVFDALFPGILPVYVFGRPDPACLKLNR